MFFPHTIPLQSDVKSGHASRRAVVGLTLVLLATAIAGCGGGSSGSAVVTPPPAVARISVLAGSVTESGATEGAATGARFNSPEGLALDANGNLYVADPGNERVRKISAAGTVSTVAGLGTGIAVPGGTTARPDPVSALGLALDKAGNLYFTDSAYVRKLTPQGQITNVFNAPLDFGDGRAGGAVVFTGLAVDASGNLFAGNGLGIRKVTPAGVTSILDGIDTATLFGTHLREPRGLALDAGGNLYARALDQTVAKFDTSGNRTTLAGQALKPGLTDGTGAAATTDYQGYLATDAAGNVYLAERADNLVRKVTPAGVVSTIAGTRGATTVDLSALPGVLPPLKGIVVDTAGTIYVSAGNAILKITQP